MNTDGATLSYQWYSNTTNSTSGGTAISGSSIANVNEALKADYGKNTNYSSVTGVTWQLFYDDPKNIYLIASDYVPGDTLPNELLTDGQYTTYCRKFANTTDSVNYTGTIMENTPWSIGADSTTIKGNALTNTYLKWVNSSVATIRNNPNSKVVAYMMDTSKWSNFAGSASGATAIGGPTLEMFALSYNAKHDTNQLGTYETVDSTNANQLRIQG